MIDHVEDCEEVEQRLHGHGGSSNDRATSLRMRSVYDGTYAICCAQQQLELASLSD